MDDNYYLSALILFGKASLSRYRVLGMHVYENHRVGCDTGGVDAFDASYRVSLALVDVVPFVSILRLGCGGLDDAFRIGWGGALVFRASSRDGATAWEFCDIGVSSRGKLGQRC